MCNVFLVLEFFFFLFVGAALLCTGACSCTCDARATCRRTDVRRPECNVARRASVGFLYLSRNNPANPCGACSEHSQCLARLRCNVRTTDLPCGGAQRKVLLLAEGKDCAPVDMSTSSTVAKRPAAPKTPSHCRTEPTTSARLCINLHDGGRCTVPRHLPVQLLTLSALPGSSSANRWWRSSVEHRRRLSSIRDRSSTATSRCAASIVCLSLADERGTG